MKNKLWKKWTLIFFASATLFLTVIGSMNFIADPLWAFGNNGWWNTFRFGFDERQQKTNYLPHVIDEIDAAVIGSSMSRLISTKDFHSLKTFNYACSSLYPDHAAEFITHAISLKGADLSVFVGIDLWNVVRPPKASDYKDPEFYIKSASKKWGSLFSMDSLRWSVKILMTNVLNYPTSRDYEFSNGYPSAIREKNLEGVELLKDAKESVARHLQNHKSYTLTYLSALQDKMTSIGITPTIFVTPVTKFYLDEMVKMGAYPTYECFIRDSVNLFGAVWNFMYLNSVTATEGYFYDSNHTNPKGGRFIAQRISGGADCPSDFGILVTKDNLEEHLEFLRKNILEALSADKK